MHSIMIGKLFVLCLCAVALALAQESSVDINSDLEKLKRLTEDGGKRVMETMAVLEAAPVDFWNLTGERIGCLVWEYNVQRTATNKTVADAVNKGMLKNKPFANFQCVANAAQETYQKLDAIKPQITINSDKIREKGLAPVKQLSLIVPAFYDYCQDLYNWKSAEMNKSQDRNKILKEVEEKMKLMKSMLNQIDDTVKSSRFKFLEEHINYAFQTENNLRKIQRDGAMKIIKCVN